MRRRIKSNAYTLIELLIVIAAIAILLTITVLSLKTAENSAKANKIITSMLNIKMAFQVAYINNQDTFDKAKDNYTNGKLLELSTISKYLDNMNAADAGKYQLLYYNKSGDRKGWWVRYTFGNDSYELRSELADRIFNEPELGILSYKSEGNIGGADKKNIASTNLYLIMKIR